MTGLDDWDTGQKWNSGWDKIWSDHNFVYLTDSRQNLFAHFVLRKIQKRHLASRNILRLLNACSQVLHLLNWKIIVHSKNKNFYEKFIFFILPLTSKYWCLRWFAEWCFSYHYKDTGTPPLSGSLGKLAAVGRWRMGDILLWDIPLEGTLHPGCYIGGDRPEYFDRHRFLKIESTLGQN